MSDIYNHMIFLSEDARNDLHEGREVEGEGFTTIINQNKKNLDFSFVQELATRYRVNSNSRKSEVIVKNKQFENSIKDSYITINFNPQKLKIDIEDILNTDNDGKEKLTFFILDKSNSHYICIADISLLMNNYVFMDEISNFLEPKKI